MSLPRELLAQIRHEFENELERYRKIAEKLHIHTVSFDDPLEDRSGLDRFNLELRDYRPAASGHGKYLTETPSYGFQQDSYTWKRAKPSLEQIDDCASRFGRDLADMAQVSR